MHPYLSSALALALSYVVFTIVNTFLERRRHIAQAEKLGCQPTPVQKSKYMGIESIIRLNDADRRGQVPEEFELMREEMGCSTWDSWLLGRKVIMTSEPRNIQAILATQFNEFELGKRRVENFSPMLGSGIFTNNGKPWEHSRALLRPQFARDQVADLELEESHLQDLFKHNIDVDKDSGWTLKLDLAPMFFRLTIDTATEFLFGQSVHMQRSVGKVDKVPGGSTEDWSALGKAFDRATHDLGVRARLGNFYWLHYPKSFRDDCKAVHKFADYYVDLALKASNEDSELGKESGRKRYVFLTELAKATRDPIELRSQLLNILLAGRDTTAGLLGWTFWLMARHPHVFEKLRASVLETFGTYESPTDISFATLKSCAYLQHVMNEVLRLYPTVPINSRAATKDTTIPVGGGPDAKSPVYVRKGEEVNYSVHVMQRRKDIFGEDAHEFKPERWATLRPGWAYLPFNGGPRICIGQQFALTEAGYIIVRFMQRFDRLENLDESTEVMHQYSVTTAPAKVEVRLHESGR